MKTIEAITIVYTGNGRTAKRSFNWLLGIESDWSMDVNPFIIQDMDIARKVEGLMYNGQPVLEQLIRKYPKHGIADYGKDLYHTEEKEEVRESDTIDLSEVVTKGISEVKMFVDEHPSTDIDELIQLETKNKNRKTLIDYLNGLK